MRWRRWSRLVFSGTLKGFYGFEKQRVMVFGVVLGITSKNKSSYIGGVLGATFVINTEYSSASPAKS
jgi:hypothetical protein